jgi:hypothetical protein
MTSMPEEHVLENRIRVYVFVLVASFSLQGAFFASALSSDGSTVAWAMWVAVLVVVAAVAIYAGVRASRLAKRYRQLKWGEK